MGVNRRRVLLALGGSWIAGSTARSRAEQPPARLAPPVESGPFLVPPEGQDAQPVWGLRDGLRVGLWPMPGPRGLFRIYAPYLGQRPGRVINFVAVEPVAAGRRGLSELERSERDRVDGKAMAVAATIEDADGHGLPWRPPTARIEQVEGVAHLRVLVGVEAFRNGARPVVELHFREDRPHEVAFRVSARPGGRRMRACVLTATMGNYARLRQLWLADRMVEASTVWSPDTALDAWGFLPHRTWEAAELRREGADVVVAATTDEKAPERERAVPRGWIYQGRAATQLWRAPVQPGLVLRVNARRTYWLSDHAIPGGVAFENFELEAPFRDGQEWRFAVEPETPEQLGFRRGADGP